ncbi:hypothetical protein [Undibacterium fentianense]|uniref:Uncharacterized protein n=1 Tax=Undibacterium fentianense TaxID=2828728 RepID=A0A941E6B8_9BURK|nr:hypothetical protein [Undibacterium fentianense]MBR7801374.1 hypothetical protein [Undibacterium fentianense]
MKQTQFGVYVAATIAIIGVLIHVVALFAGPTWYAFFGAPPSIVESARQGTWLAPVSGAVIALLMGICALYALSALGHIRRLPLLRTGLIGMACICSCRALILWPLMLSHPELRNTFEIVAALVWGAAGFGFFCGFRLVHQSLLSRGDAN